MAKRMIRVDFFRVAGAQADKTVDILRAAKAHGPIEFGDTPVELSELKEHAGIIEGDFTRIQMMDIPPRAKKNGQRRDVALDDDEGLGHETAFLYHISTKVFAIQRNRQGVSLSAVMHLLQSHVDDPSEIELLPIADSKVIERALKLSKNARRVHLRVASPESVSHIGNGAVKSGIERVMAELSSPVLEITASMGSNQGHLRNLHGLLKGLFDFRSKLDASGIEGAEGMKAVIVGFDDITGRNDEVDVFSEFISEVVPINRTRRVLATERRRAVFDAWMKRKPEIVSLFV